MNKNKLSRRDFLKVTGKGTLGLAIASHIGCDNFDGIPESAWRDFDNSLQGILLRPGDPAYPQSNRPWNLLCQMKVAPKTNLNPLPTTHDR